MLTFRPIELQDKECITSFLRIQEYGASDLCFSNLYCWGKTFDTRFAVTDEWLFIRFKDRNNRNSYLKPIGGGDLKQAIERLMEDHRAFDTVFQLRGLTREMMAEVEAAMPNIFDYRLNRSVSDYIYTREKLVDLQGKKLQSKRNHINRFKRETNWRYATLTGDSATMRACKKMLDRWALARQEDDPSVVYDDRATTLMLEHFDYLGLRGGVIYIDEEIAAFTIGEPLTQDTLVVHVEKAFSDVHGAYAIINQQFVEHEASEFTYVNREEDMGMENLRKAKLSYQPDILLEKYNARLKS